MKVRVKVDMGDRKIDEVISGIDSTTILAQAKAQVAKELGWKGMVLNTMSPVQFAQLAAKMYNEKFGTSFALPETPDQFIEFGKATGNIEVIEA